MLLKRKLINKYTNYVVILVLVSITISLFSLFGFIYNTSDEKNENIIPYTVNNDFQKKDNNSPKTDSRIFLTPGSIVALYWVSAGVIGDAIKGQSSYDFANILSDHSSFKSEIKIFNDAPFNYNLMASAQVFNLRISRLKAG